jgi:hypothetical protein
MPIAHENLKEISSRIFNFSFSAKGQDQKSRSINKSNEAKGVFEKQLYHGQMLQGNTRDPDPPTVGPRTQDSTAPLNISRESTSQRLPFFYIISPSTLSQDVVEKPRHYRFEQHPSRKSP